MEKVFRVERKNPYKTTYYTFYYVPNQYRKAVKLTTDGHEISHGVEIPEDAIEMNFDDMKNWLPSTKPRAELLLHRIITKMDFVRELYRSGKFV